MSVQPRWLVIGASPVALLATGACVPATSPSPVTHVTDLRGALHAVELSKELRDDTVHHAARVGSGAWETWGCRLGA